MKSDVGLPVGFWITEDKHVTLGVDETVKDVTGPFIELNVPEVGTVLSTGEPVVTIVGTNEDVEVTVPFRAEVVEVNTELVEGQNVTERDWLLRLDRIAS